VDLDRTGWIRYTEFLAATIEAQGAISEERLAEAFDRFDTDDSGYISVDDLVEILGKDFPRHEIRDIIGDAVDPHGRVHRDRSKISYSAFLKLWERNEKKEMQASKLRMLGSQASLSSLAYVYDEDNSVSSSYNIDDSQEAAKARATFLMDKHKKTHVGFEDTTTAITTDNHEEQKTANYSSDYDIGDGIDI